jgi:hypothetical protein
MIRIEGVPVVAARLAAALKLNGREAAVGVGPRRVQSSSSRRPKGERVRSERRNGRVAA